MENYSKLQTGIWQSDLLSPLFINLIMDIIKTIKYMNEYRLGAIRYNSIWSNSAILIAESGYGLYRDLCLNFVNHVNFQYEYFSNEN